MAPIGKLWIPPIHPHRNRLLAVSALASIELDIPSDFVFGETNKTPTYLAKFPLGKVPSLEVYPSPTLPDGFNLTEANAIARYLCEISDRRDVLLGESPEERAWVAQWMSFAHENLQLECLMPLGRMALGADAYDAAVEADKDGILVRYLGYLEEVLSKSGTGWLVDLGEGPSLADVSVAAALRIGMLFVVERETREKYPSVLKWWRRLTEEEVTKEGLGAPQGWCEKRNWAGRKG